MSPRLRHFPQGGNAKSHFQWWKWLMRRFAVVSVAAGLTGLAGFRGVLLARQGPQYSELPRLRLQEVRLLSVPAPTPRLLGPPVLRFSGSPVLRFSGSPVLRLPASGFRLPALATCPSILQFSGPPVSRPFALGSRFPVLLDPLAPAPWLRLLGSGSLGPSWLSLLPRLAPHRHPAADYLRASLASMHSVAWGTFIRRSFGMSLPVVLQMP